MALITCPECGHSISDKAAACPSCGFPIQNISAANISKTDAGSQAKSGKPRKRKPIIFCILSILIIGIVVCLILFLTSEKWMEPSTASNCLGTTQDTIAQDSAKIESTAQAQHSAEELLEKAKQKKRAEYIANLKQFSLRIAAGGIESALVCQKVNAVWYDTIYEEQSPDTVAYTQTDGKFHDDFSVSLDKLYASDELATSLSRIEYNEKVLPELFKSLQNPEPEFKECFAEAKTMYEAYCKLTNLALCPTGTLNSYTESYTQYLQESASHRKILEAMIPNE